MFAKTLKLSPSSVKVVSPPTRDVILHKKSQPVYGATKNFENTNLPKKNLWIQSSLFHPVLIRNRKFHLDTFRIPTYHHNYNYSNNKNYHNTKTAFDYQGVFASDNPVLLGMSPAQIGKWFWMFLGCIAFGIPFLMSSLPDQAVKLYLALDKSNAILEDDDDKTKHIRHVLKEVGLEHPEKITIMSTDHTGPTTFGTATGAVILIPKDLLSFMDPNAILEITLQDDKTQEPFQQQIAIRDLTDAQRKKFLEDFGMLFPCPAEMDFVIGHEGGHILHNDTGRKVNYGVSVLVGSRIMIGLMDRSVQFLSGSTVSQNLFRNRPSQSKIAQLLRNSILQVCLPKLRNPMLQSFLAFGIASAAVFKMSQEVEREADITSASCLHCAKEARQLVEKKITQNFSVKKSTDSVWLKSVITPSGNDITEILHPSLTKQLRYLSELEKEQEYSSRLTHM